jgi:hypothetical protein
VCVCVCVCVYYLLQVGGLFGGDSPWSHSSANAKSLPEDVRVEVGGGVGGVGVDVALEKIVQEEVPEEVSAEGRGRDRREGGGDGRRREAEGRRTDDGVSVSRNGEALLCNVAERTVLCICTHTPVSLSLSLSLTLSLSLSHKHTGAVGDAGLP